MKAPTLVIASLAAVAIIAGVGGALAEEPPPVVTPTPAPPAGQPAEGETHGEAKPDEAKPPEAKPAEAKPDGAASPGEAQPAGAPGAPGSPGSVGAVDPNAPIASGVLPDPAELADCMAAMPQVLAELDYWRGRAAELAAAPRPTSPAKTSAVPPVVAPVPTAPTGAATPGPAGLALGPGSTPQGAGAIERPRIDQVAAALKEMKPKDAAAVFASWDDALAIAVLEQLSGRAVSAIATALPPDHAARLLAKLSLAPRSEP